jgi:small subunit ribosomal protein S17
MADEKDNENETPAAPDDADRSEIGQPTTDAPEAPQAQAEAPDAEAPAADEPAAEEPIAEEPVVETAEAPEAVEEAPASEPEEQLSPKERRRRTRSKHDGQAHATRTPEERHADRLAARKTKAVRRRARRLQERAKAAERRAAAPAPEPLAPVHAPVEGRRRMRQGIVISDKASKTITVRIDVARRHRRYEKIVRSSSTLHAHDENNDANEGDTVRVIESRPLSRSKRWALVDVLERAR